MRRLDYSQTCIQPEIFKVLAAGLECLEEIDLHEVHELNGTNLRELLPSCTQTLRKLNLANCPLVNDEDKSPNLTI